MARKIVLAFALAFARVVEASAPDPVAAPPADAPATDGPVLVLLTASDTEAAPDTEAIAAHLHGLDVDLRVRAVAIDALDLAQAHARASAIADDEGAVAVLWVRSEAGRATLHLVRPRSQIVMVRSVEIDPAAPSEGLEALGIVTHAIVGALLDGAPVEMEAVAVAPPAEPVAATPPSPAPAPKEPPKKRARGRALLAVGYVGTSYAREVPWQSGVTLQAAWGWPFGLHVGAGYAFLQRVRSPTELGVLELRRHPAELWAGYHRAWRNLGYGGELALVLDATVRHSERSDPRVTAADDRGRLVAGLVPRARVSVVAVWRLEVFATIGLEAWLSRVRYAVAAREGEDPDVVITPRRVRATATIGFAVRL